MCEETRGECLRDLHAREIGELSPRARSAFVLYQKLGTQYEEVGTFAGLVRTGLRYSDVVATAAIYDIDLTPDVMDLVRSVEATVLDHTLRQRNPKVAEERAAEDERKARSEERKRRREAAARRG